MRKLGILLNDFSQNDTAFWSIYHANKYKGNADIIGFYSIIGRPYMTPQFALMHAAEVYSFDGAVVATNLAAARKLLSCPSPSHKLFYLWDLEWLRQPFDYSQLSEVYKNESLILVARTDEHAKIIRNCWDRDAAVVENMDIEQILKVIDDNDAGGPNPRGLR